MSNITAGLTAALMSLGGAAVNRRNLTRKTPTPNSVLFAKDQLLDGAERYINKQSPNNPITSLNYLDTPSNVIEAGVPFYKSDLDAFANYGHDHTGSPSIQMNPNADRVFLGHELGHVAFGQSQAGNLIQELRNNPKLKKALIGASVLGGGAAAALIPGDDDMAQSLAAASVLSIPTLVDEAEASRRGLGIMKEAGMPANMRQRGRLAGAYLSYLGAPLALAASGNLTGNMIDANPSANSQVVVEDPEMYSQTRSTAY